MKAFIALCAILACAQGASINHRILGGEDAEPGQFPFIVSLRQASKDRHFCGGTIISNRVILTAAHCKVYDESEIVVVAGTNKQNDGSAARYHPENFIINPDYDSSTITYDVAVIVLKEEIEFSDLVQPISLASRAISPRERLTATGWGITSYPGTIPNDLQWMQMNVVDPEICELTTGEPVQGKICTLEHEGIGVCSGDSGGPLINELNEIVGIASSAYLCALGKPDFFTDVYYYKDWIVENSAL